MSARRLVLITQSYPFTTDEASFLEPELVFLQQQFSQVTLVPEVIPPDTRAQPISAEVDTTYATRWARIGRGALLAGLTRKSDAWRDVARAAALARPEGLRRWAAFFGRAHAAASWIRSRPSADELYYTYWLTGTTLGLCWGASGSARVATRVHGFDLYEDRQTPPFLPGRTSTYRRVDAVFPISEHGAQYLRSRYPSFAAKYEVARLGVPDAGTLNHPSSDGRLRLLSCSRVVSLKRVELILAAVERAAQTSIADIGWTHIGNGPDMPHLRERVERAMRSNPRIRVELAGALPNADVHAFYRQHPVDLFVNTSSSEGLPVSIMEALSYGVPTCAPPVGGVAEAVTPESGILLRSAEPSAVLEDLASAVRRAAQKPELLRSLRGGARLLWEQRFDARRNHSAFAARLSQIAAVRE